MKELTRMGKKLDYLQVGSEISRAYNRSIHLAERKKIIQWWSDYLEDIS